MSKTYLLLLLFIPFYSYSQQDSRLRIDSGNGNDISVTQQGKDNFQKSDVVISHSDSNKLNINQSNQEATTSKSKSFWDYLNNINIILGIIVAVITITSFLFIRKKRINKSIKRR